MFKKTKIQIAMLATAAIISVPTLADTSGDTKYPIVLVHGLAGFDTLLADYFYGVKRTLSNVGATEVFTPEVTGWATSEYRGEELLEYLEDLRVETGYQKFNLIGHSQGGLDSRYVASVAPEYVASVTSIGTPHLGSEAADVVKDLDPNVQNVAFTLGNAIGTMMSALGGTKQDVSALGTLEALNTWDAKQFNIKYPEGLRQGDCKATPEYNAGSWWWPKMVKNYSVNDGDHVVNGISYYSWTGVYNPVFDSNLLDPADVVLAITSTMMPGQHDGLVTRCSTHMGKVIRDDYTLNHADEINGMFGIRSLWSTSPLPLYSEHARRLKKAGL